MTASIRLSHERCSPASLSFGCTCEQYALATLRTMLTMLTLRPSFSLCNSALRSQKWLGGEKEGSMEGSMVRAMVGHYGGSLWWCTMVGAKVGQARVGCGHSMCNWVRPFIVE